MGVSKKAKAHQKKKERTAKNAEAEGHSKHKGAADHQLKKKRKEHVAKAAGRATAKEIAEKKLSQHHHRSAKQIAAAEKAWHAQSKHIWQLKLKNKIAVATEEG